MRSWSVLRWPVALAAMSESTPSAQAAEPCAQALRARRRRENPSAGTRRPSIASISRRSMATTRPLPSAAPTCAAATWLQPPGAAPRSTMRWPGFEQLVLVVDLDQLVGGARAIALAPGLRHIGIVELALEPAGSRRASACAPSCTRVFSARPPSRPEPPPVIAPRPRRCGPTRSSRISWLSMPSRRPRSAIRSRSAGKLRPDRLEDGAAGQHQIGALVRRCRRWRRARRSSSRAGARPRRRPRARSSHRPSTARRS